MNTQFHWTISLLISWSLLSCTPETADSNQEKLVPVVEGYLRAGQEPNVKVYKQIGLESGSEMLTLEGLTLTLNVNGIDYVMIDQSDGEYTAQYVLQAGDNVKLSFWYEGAEISANTVIPIKPSNFEVSDQTYRVPNLSGGFDLSSGPPEMPDPLQLNWDNSDNSYYLVVVENLESEPEAIVDFGDAEPPAIIFRNDPTTDDTYELNSFSFSYLGTHRIYLYHVQPDYATLYDDNSNSSQNLQTPQTGISNGVGIFTGINSDFVEIEVEFE